MSVTAGTDEDAEEARSSRWLQFTDAKRRRFLAVLCIVGILNAVDRNVIGVLLEPIKAEFRASDTRLGFLTGIAFAIFYAVLGIPIARWADRGDRVTVISVSMAAWSVMTCFCGIARTFWELVFARFGVGAGEAGSIPATHSLIADYYSPAERARAIGVFTASQSVGYAIGLSAGGFLAARYGWRSAFWAAGILGLVLVPFIRWLLNEPRTEASQRAQVAHEEATGKSVRTLMGKRAYRLILAAIVVYYTMAYGAITFIVSLMIRVHGQSIAGAGTLFAAITTIGAVVGAVGMLLALPLYELALWSPDLTTMVGLLLIGSAMLNAVVPSMFSALHVVCGSRRRAFSVALAFLFVNSMGVGLGPVITGALSDFFAVSRGAGEGLRYALMIVTAALLPAAFLMYRSKRHLCAEAED